MLVRNRGWDRMIVCPMVSAKNMILLSQQWKVILVAGGIWFSEVGGIGICWIETRGAETFLQCSRRIVGLRHQQ